jgi:hypothetical protein
VVQANRTFTFAYNGFGDRVQQAVDGLTTRYAVDLAAGLPQVLSDSSNTYPYGPDRYIITPLNQ